MLKIKNALMAELGLAITYAQMIAMGREKLVHLMLNLKAHFLAIETCKLLKLSSETLSQIFIDWAITAIDRDRGDRQDELAERIYDRFNQLQSEKDMKINDIALTEIAHEAAKKEKKVLAKKLLEKETSITRKIPVLVWMKEYESSLEEAFLGKDTNLINLVLIKFFAEATDEKIMNLFKKAATISQDLIINIKNFLIKTNREHYLKALFEINKSSEMYMRETLNEAFMALDNYPVVPKATAANVIVERVERIKKLKQLIDEKKQKELSFLVSREVRSLEYHLNTKEPAPSTVGINNFKVRTLEEICVETLVKCKGDTSSKSEFAKIITEFKIGPKKVNMIKIKALALLEKLNELKEFVIKLNKKEEEIAYTTIFKYLDSIGKHDYCTEIVKAVQNFNFQFAYFNKAGDIKNLAESCAKFKRPDILQSMLAKTKNEADRQLIAAAASKF